MLNTFLYNGQNRTEAILLGSGAGAGVSPEGKSPQTKVKDPSHHQLQKDGDRMAALCKTMDELTDATLVRDAEKYRAVLMG